MLRRPDLWPRLAWRAAAGILADTPPLEPKKMKSLIMTLAVLLCLPVAGLCQTTAQPPVTVPLPLSQPQEEPTYQDTAGPASLPGDQASPGAAVISGESSSMIDATSPTTPGTAEEQGYEPDLAELQERLRREAEDYAAMNSPRQLGQVIHAPKVSNPVIRDGSSHAWLRDWATVLSGVGISPAKVNFEAARLTREDFAMWASRMVWAYGTPAQARQMECCSP